MDAIGNFEENFVAGHGVGNARAAENGRIERADGGDDHGERDPERGAAAGDVCDDVGGDVLRSGGRRKRKHAKARGTEEKVNDGDEPDATDERARKILLRVRNFGADEI